MNFDTDVKAAWRLEIYADMETPRTSIIDLPGVAALSVKHLLQNGKITTDTNQQWVERDKRIVAKLRKVSDDMGFTDRCAIWHGDLEKYTLSRPVDNINADMMCGTTLPLLRWLRDTKAFIMPGCYVVLNTITWSRNNQFGDWFHLYWQENSYYRMLMKDVIMHKILDKADVALAEANFLLNCAFNSFSVVQGPALSIKGSGKRFGMVSNAIILDGNRRAREYEFPSIEELASVFEHKPVNRTHDEIRAIFKTFFAERYGPVGLHLVRDGDDQWSVVTNPLDRTVPAVVENAKLRELALRFGFPWE